MAKPTKRFWVGSPDGYGQPDDDLAEGSLSPDEDGNVYLNRRLPAGQESKDGQTRDSSTPATRKRPVGRRNARGRRK